MSLDLERDTTRVTGSAKMETLEGFGKIGNTGGLAFIASLEFACQACNSQGSGQPSQAECGCCVFANLSSSSNIGEDDVNFTSR